MQPTPLVSVIMCTYNGSRFIDEQVASIVQQDYPNIEIIITDDCSTDDTYTKLLAWQEKDPRVTVIQNETNLGYNKNFEQAIQRGKGELIALSDQDDIWLPQKISKEVAAFTSDDIVLVHNRSVRIENGHFDYNKAFLQHHFEGDDTRKLFFFNQVMGHDMLLRRSLVKHIVPIPPLMSYDWWITVIATCYGRIVSVEDFLVHHRIHGSNNFFSNNAASKKKELDLADTLKLFAAIPALKPNAKAYLQELIPLLEQQTKEGKVSFNRSLFKFLYKHRRIIFGHKKRKLPELSYLKNALKYARMNFKGKGISI